MSAPLAATDGTAVVLSQTPTTPTASRTPIRTAVKQYLGLKSSMKGPNPTPSGKSVFLAAARTVSEDRFQYLNGMVMSITHSMPITLTCNNQFTISFYNTIDCGLGALP